MQIIEMTNGQNQNFLEVFEMFITSQAAKGVADITLRNYRYNMKNIQKYFDAKNCLTKLPKEILKLW